MLSFAAVFLLVNGEPVKSRPSSRFLLESRHHSVQSGPIIESASSALELDWSHSLEFIIFKFGNFFFNKKTELVYFSLFFSVQRRHMS